MIRKKEPLPADGDSRLCRSCGGTAIFNRSAEQLEAESVAMLGSRAASPEPAWYCPDCGGSEPCEE